MTQTDLIALLFRASQAEFGILLRVSDPRRAIAAFARARESHPDAELPPTALRALAEHTEGNLVILSRGGQEALRAAVARSGDDTTPQEELF